MTRPTEVLDYYSVDALSNSAIKQIHQSPAHYKVWAETKRQPSDAMRIGTALHSYVLDGIRNFPIYGGATKTLNSKEGRQFLMTYPNGLTYEEYLAVKSMGESILSVELLAGIIKRSKRELQIYGSELSSDGLKVPVKAMLDSVTDAAILDLKTTSDPATRFPYAVKSYSYDIQAAWYLHMAKTHYDGREDRSFYFVVVESFAPYGVLIYEAKPETIASGWDKCKAAIDVYAHCKTWNRWPGYDTNTILSV